MIKLLWAISEKFSKMSQLPTFHKYCSNQIVILHFARFIKKNYHNKILLYMLQSNVWLELLLFSEADMRVDKNVYNLLLVKT